MDATRFDTIARRFAVRRSRRQALIQAGTGLAAGLAAAGPGRPSRAQDTSPPANEPAMLFLQSFRGGSVAPREGAEDRYTLTLEEGLGQTIYFSDRPERIVGASPTPQFLAELGFPEDNPPNAALVVEKAGGETEIAVIELFAPSYDEASRTATYEVAVLDEWENALGMGLTETPTDLAAFEETFGAAHLFIDGCRMVTPNCGLAGSIVGQLPRQMQCSHPHGEGRVCVACPTWGGDCNARFPECNNQCVALSPP